MKNEKIYNYFRVEQLENKNQFIIYTPDERIFQSYNSIVAISIAGELILGRDWDYSKTTLKHLYIFLENYAYFRKWADIRDLPNKRKAIQKLINEGVIKYEEELH